MAQPIRCDCCPRPVTMAYLYDDGTLRVEARRHHKDQFVRIDVEAMAAAINGDNPKVTVDKTQASPS